MLNVKIPSLSLVCFTCSGAYIMRVCSGPRARHAGRSAEGSAGRMCSRGAGGRTAALHDYVEKYVCAYVCCLAAACYHGPFPVFCPAGETELLGMDPVVERLAFVSLGPGVIAQQPKRGIVTLQEKGPCQDWQILAKSPSSGIPPLFQSDRCPHGLVWFQPSCFQELMGFTVDSVSQTC